MTPRRLLSPLRRDDVEPGRDGVAAAQPVLDVDGVVLPVGAEEPEEDRGPAAQAEPFLLERPEEAELARGDLVVVALPLRHAVDEDAVRRLRSPRQWNAPALHDRSLNARRRAS